MADLSFAERQTLEKGFGMGSGYVLDFSNNTLQEFIFESVGFNIYDNKYSANGDSKAKRLRAFFSVEPNHIVGTLIANLVEHATVFLESPQSDMLESCQKIADRLRQGAPVLEVLPPESEESTFRALTKSVRQAINENQPETGLDRLHTYFITYLRQVCDAHAITTTREEPAHSVMGKYVKWLKNNGRVESEMTGRILTYAGATIDAFNRVRNEQSLAHPNPMLNYHEALLIFNHVVAIVNFIRVVEVRAQSDPATPTANDIPF